MRKNVLKIRIILWLILAIIIICLGYLKIVPSGKISYAYDFKRLSYFIGNLTPAERVTSADGQAIVKGGPVYFFLNPPRRFTKAKVTVKFKNNTNYSIMELGLLNDKVSYSYELKPLQNKIIDQLALVWSQVKTPNGAILLERERKYDKIEQFLNDLSANRRLAEQTALYNYDFKNKFLLDDYEPEHKKKILDYKFRGSFQFYTYIKNEVLNYDFDFTDLNFNQESGSVKIKVFSPNGMIYSTEVTKNQADDQARRGKINLPNLSEGIYRISVTANDNIITSRIVAGSSRFALIDKVWLAAGNKENLVLYTSSRLINAQTINPASLGRILVGNGTLDLVQTYQQFSLPVTDRPARIELSKNDIIISGDGVFSFSQAEMLDPSLKILGGNFDLNSENINYVLANYQTPRDSQGFETASADFDLTKAQLEKGKYQFLISTPGFKAEEISADQIIIKEIKVELEGISLWQKLKKIF